MILLGYLAFLDPPRRAPRRPSQLLRSHGVDVKVLTGDNDLVTRKICQEVGIPVDRHPAGRGDREADRTPSWPRWSERTTVFAKLTPAQKERIIQALHAKDHVVASWATASTTRRRCKAADVGISVDTAVDIAKESADIILLEKSLLVLEDGVLEGRKVFGNIIKYIKMGASSNFGNMFSVLGASIFLPFLPMLPIQILINNLLYDFSQTAIPTDHVDEEYLASPRKWEIGNICRFMLFIGPISSIFDYATFAMMFYVFDAWNNPSLFQTGWFVEIPSDPDPHHPHHPNGEDSVHREPRKPRADCDDGDHLHGRNDVALHLGGFGIRFRAASLALLAAGCGHAGDIRNTHSPCESLVHSQVGTLRKPVARNSTNVLRGQCLTAESDQPHTGAVGLSIN